MMPRTLLTASPGEVGSPYQCYQSRSTMDGRAVRDGDEAVFSVSSDADVLMKHQAGRSAGVGGGGGVERGRTHA